MRMSGRCTCICNYPRHTGKLPDENPPVGLILCTGKGAALARYALEGLPNKIMATEYLTALPPHELLEAELDRTRRILSQSRCDAQSKKDNSKKEAHMSLSNLFPAHGWMLPEIDQAAEKMVWRCYHLIIFY